MAGPVTERAAVPPIDARVLIVEARYYADIADALLAGAGAALKAAGATGDVVTVPGALEIAQALAFVVDAAQSRDEPYDAAVVLGCVVRGETGHYDIVAGESARAVTDLALGFDLPVGNAILTVETMEQAEVRADPARGDKGGDAVRAALTLLHLKRQANQDGGD